MSSSALPAGGVSRAVARTHLSECWHDKKAADKKAKGKEGDSPSGFASIQSLAGRAGGATFCMQAVLESIKLPADAVGQAATATLSQGEADHQKVNSQLPTVFRSVTGRQKARLAPTEGMKLRLANCTFVKRRGAVRDMVVPSGCVAVVVPTAAAAQGLLDAPLCSPSQVLHLAAGEGGEQTMEGTLHVVARPLPTSTTKEWEATGLWLEDPFMGPGSSIFLQLSSSEGGHAMLVGDGEEVFIKNPRVCRMSMDHAPTLKLSEESVVCVKPNSLSGSPGKENSPSRKALKRVLGPREGGLVRSEVTTLIGVLMSITLQIFNRTTTASLTLQIDGKNTDVRLEAVQESLLAVYDMRVGHTIIVAGSMSSTVDNVLTERGQGSQHHSYSWREGQGQAVQSLSATLALLCSPPLTAEIGGDRVSGLGDGLVEAVISGTAPVVGLQHSHMVCGTRLQRASFELEEFFADEPFAGEPADGGQQPPKRQCTNEPDGNEKGQAELLSVDQFKRGWEEPGLFHCPLCNVECTQYGVGMQINLQVSFKNGLAMNATASDLASEDLLEMQSSTFINLSETAQAAALHKLIGQQFLATVCQSSKTASMQLCRALKL